MSKVSAADVKALRDRTGLPFKDCSAALAETNGDIEKAVEYLRTKNVGLQDKFSSREAGEGRIGVFIDPTTKNAAIVEVRCETAPVTKNDAFQAMVTEIAQVAANSAVTTVEQLNGEKLLSDPKLTVQGKVAELIGLIRENMRVARFARVNGTVGSYVHHDGTLGVLVVVEGTPTDPQVLKDVCMHIAFKNPIAALRDQVPAAVVEKEREIAKAQAAATGKPAQLQEKIAEGKVQAFLKDNVLNEQPFVKDESVTIAELLAKHGVKLVGFVRFKVGEA